MAQPFTIYLHLDGFTAIAAQASDEATAYTRMLDVLSCAVEGATASFSNTGPGQGPQLTGRLKGSDEGIVVVAAW